MSFDQLVDGLIWEANLDFGRVEIWVLLFPCLLICFKLSFLQLFNCLSDLVTKFIFEIFRMFDHRVDGQVWNTVAFGNEFSEM